jgi:hypothetical protein
VRVADLTGHDEGTEIDTLLSDADFHTAEDADAERIKELLGSDDSYMDTDNACFNDDVAVRFTFTEGRQLDAIVGLTCWNVHFVSRANGQATPSDGYLAPNKLEELALALKHVVPSLDIEAVG